MKKIILGTFLLVFALAPVLQAQEKTKTENKEDIRSKIGSFEDKAEKSEKAGKWVEAIGHYNEIRELLKVHSDIYEERSIFEKKRRDALFKLGYCYLQGFLTGKGDKKEFLRKAEKNLKDVLRFSSSQGEAYYYLAKIYAIRYKENPKGENSKKIEKDIKENLKEASKNGFNVFVGVSTDPHLSFLKRDAEFIMGVLKAVKKYDWDDIVQLTDPFKPHIKLYRRSDTGKTGAEETVPIGPEDGGGGIVGKKEQQKLLNDIKSTFKQLQDLINQASAGGDKAPGPKVIQLWQRLQNLISRKEDIFIPSLQNQLNDVLKDLAKEQDRLEKVQLAYYFNQGRDIVREMRNAFVLRKYDKVVNLWGKLRELAHEMSKSGNENFRKTAQSLLNNGESFAKQAKTYISLRRIEHNVTGIIIEQYPEESRVAIVNNRPYKVDEYILDSQGKPLPLRIKKIEKGFVVFVYQKVEIKKYLRE